MFTLDIKSVPAAAAGKNAGGRFLQSPLWAAFKAAHGWKPCRFSCQARLADTGQTFDFEVSLLARRLSFFGTLAYVPLGIDFNPAAAPVLPAGAYEVLLAEFAAALKSLLPQDAFCLRFDPPLVKGSDSAVLSAPPFPRPYGFVKPCSDVQPPDTVLLDLSLAEGELLERMKPKWRYNIRLAEKKGVTVRAGGQADIDMFYALYLETAGRDGIAIHAKNYYADLLQRSLPETPVTLYMAEHEGEAIAAIITIFTPFEAVYLYGASSNAKRNLMATYLLQWTAIRAAQAFGSHWYDFYGIPPDDSENHPMHGLYRFKTGFGGQIVHRVGSIDYPLSFKYKLFTAVERARAVWYKKIKKLFAGR